MLHINAFWVILILLMIAILSFVLYINSTGCYMIDNNSAALDNGSVDLNDI